MGRLIEIGADTRPLPPRLTLRVGDLLAFAATGGEVQSGGAILECLGAFRSGVVGTNGEVLTPAGPPDRVLFLARQPGAAVVRVVTGDPWGAHRSTSVAIQLEA